MNRNPPLLGQKLWHFFIGTGFVTNTIATIEPGGPMPWWLSATFATLGAAYLGMSMSSDYRKQIEKRKVWRKARYRAWLNMPVPELVEQTPWSEIERGIAGVLAEGKEPTYERAQDWLRREEQAHLDQERAEEDRKRYVEMQMAERNKFYDPKEVSYRHAVGCDHTGFEERVLLAGSVSYICSNCGHCRFAVEHYNPTYVGGRTPKLIERVTEYESGRLKPNPFKRRNPLNRLPPPPR
jgi:hypothetical protein